MDKNINNPKVTVLMPVYNSEKYLRESIESILNQTFTNFEFLIINDGSTDDSKEIIKSYTDPRIRLVNNKINLKITKTLNKGLNLAKGEYIARMDADDISLPNRLKTQVDFVNKNPNFVIVGGNADAINEKGSLLKKIRLNSNKDLIKFNLIFFNNFLHSSILFKKSIIKIIGGYNDKYQNAQDFDLWFRTSRKHDVTNLNKTLIKYRIHKKSIIHSEKTQPVVHKIVKKIIFKNCNYYTYISKNKFKILFNAIANKNNYHVKSFSNLVIGLKTYTRLFHCYIKKEKLTIKQIIKIFHYFLKHIFNFFRWYIKYNFPTFYNLIKKTKKC